ncbi:hypothetical protein [Algoriphagus boritolerans]|uniref:hypothetical protein n=1 Tax=Algoriphagus boritolerans TaxID=308111 RepID=UPI002FCDF2E3
MDEEPNDVVLNTFDQSTMYYLSPVSSFGISLGYNAMRDKMDTELGLSQKRLVEFIGMGMGWRNRRMFYGLHLGTSALSGLSKSVVGNLTNKSQTSDTFFDLSVGRALVSTPQFYLILRAEGGLHVRSLQITQIDQGAFDLNDFGNAPGIAWPEMEHISGTLGVAVEYMPKAFRPISVLESIQFGYKTGIGAPDWRSPDLTLANSFSDRMSMLFLKVMVVISREK